MPVISKPTKGFVDIGLIFNVLILPELNVLIHIRTPSNEYCAINEHTPVPVMVLVIIEPVLS